MSSDFSEPAVARGDSEPKPKLRKREPRLTTKFWKLVPLCSLSTQKTIRARYDAFNEKYPTHHPERAGAYEEWKKDQRILIDKDLASRQLGGPTREEIYAQQLRRVARKVPLDRLADETSIVPWVLRHIGCLPKEIDLAAVPSRAAVNVLIMASEDAKIRHTLVNKLFSAKAGGSLPAPGGDDDPGAVDMLSLIDRS